MRWLILIWVLTASCQDNYTHEELVGTWKIIEIKFEENEMSTAFLGAETIQLSESGAYVFPGSINEKGEWTINKDMLRLHTESIKDIAGNVIYDGHDSEWKVGKSKKFMLWRGTRRFHNENLRVILEKETEGVDNK